MNRFGPSILVEAGGQKHLFDAGRGALQRLNQLNVRWQGCTGRVSDAPALRPRSRITRSMVDRVAYTRAKYSTPSVGTKRDYKNDVSSRAGVRVRYPDTVVR